MLLYQGLAWSVQVLHAKPHSTTQSTAIWMWLMLSLHMSHNKSLAIVQWPTPRAIIALDA
jgi:hypothetical protein